MTDTTIKLKSQATSSDYKSSTNCVDASYIDPSTEQGKTVEAGSSILLSETQITPPLPSDPGFVNQSGATQNSFCFSSPGRRTVFVWTKDSLNNVNPTPYSDRINFLPNLSLCGPEFDRSIVKSNISSGITWGTRGSVGTQEPMVTVASRDGRVLVAWVRKNNAEAGARAYAAVFGRDGRVISPTTAISSVLSSVGLFGIDAAANYLTGGWIVIFQINSAIGTGDRELFYKRYDKNLVAQDVSEVRVVPANTMMAAGPFSGTGSGSGDGGPRIKCDDLGRFTVAWLNSDKTTGYKRFNNDGTVSIAQTNLPGPGPITSTPALALWVHPQSGKFVIGHENNAQIAIIRRFAANGTAEPTNGIITLSLVNDVLNYHLEGRYGYDGFLLTFNNKLQEYNASGTALYALQTYSPADGATPQNMRYVFMAEPEKANSDFRIGLIYFTSSSSQRVNRFFILSTATPPQIIPSNAFYDGVAGVDTGTLETQVNAVIATNPYEFWRFGNPRSDLGKHEVDVHDVSYLLPNIALEDTSSLSTTLSDSPNIFVNHNCTMVNSNELFTESPSTPLPSDPGFQNRNGNLFNFTLANTPGPHTVHIWFKNPDDNTLYEKSATINLLTPNINRTYLASANLLGTTSRTYLASALLQKQNHDSSFTSSAFLFHPPIDSSFISSAFLFNSQVDSSFISSAFLEATFDPEPLLFDQITSDSALTRDHVISVQFSLDATVSPVQGWLLSESQQTEPSPADSNFRTIMPQTFALQQVPNAIVGEGQSRTVYLWVKDSTQVLNHQPGKDSIQLGDAPAGSIILTDIVSGSFLFSNSNVVSTIIQNFPQVRDGNVSGFLVSETQTTQPLYNDGRFTVSAPATIALSPGNGNKDVFLWLKNRYYVSAVPESSSIFVQTGFPSFTHILKPGTNLVTPALAVSPAPMRASQFLTQSTDQLFYLDANANIQFILGIDVELDPGSDIPLEGSIGYLVFATGLTEGQIRTVTYTGLALAN